MDTPELDPNSPEGRVRATRITMGDWTLEDYQGLSAVMVERVAQLQKWPSDHDDLHYLSQWGALFLRYLTPIATADMYDCTLSDYQRLRDHATKIGALSIALYASLERHALRYQRHEAAGQLASAPEPPAQDAEPEPQRRFQVVFDNPSGDGVEVKTIHARDYLAARRGSRFQSGNGFGMPVAIFHDGACVWQQQPTPTDERRYRIHLQHANGDHAVVVGSGSTYDNVMAWVSQLFGEWQVTMVIRDDGRVVFLD